MIQVLDCIYEAERIALLTHVPPDGDTLGSALALQRWLQGMGKHSVQLYCTDIPQAYSFLPGVEGVATKYDGTPHDLAIAVDCATLRMMKPFVPVFERACTTVVLDHHLSNEGFGDYNIIDPRAAATAEVAYRLIQTSGYPLDKQAATCLYTGLSSDTGNFCYSNTSASALAVASALVKLGIDVVDISSHLYRCRSAQKTRLIGRALGSLQLHAGGRISTLVLTAQDFAMSGANERDCDGIVEYGREVDGVEVAALVREMHDHVFKISLRSKYYADVRKVAETLGGGGHERASGCKYTGELSELLPLLVERLEGILA